MRPPLPTNARNGGAGANHVSSFAVLKHKHKLTMARVVLPLRETQSTAVDLGGDDVAVRRQIEKVHHLGQLQQRWKIFKCGLTNKKHLCAPLQGLFQNFKHGIKIRGRHHANRRQESQVVWTMPTHERNHAIFKKMLQQFGNAILVASKRRQAHHAANATNKALAFAAKWLLHRWKEFATTLDQVIRLGAKRRVQLGNAPIGAVIAAIAQARQNRKTRVQRGHASAEGAA